MTTPSPNLIRQVEAGSVWNPQLEELLFTYRMTGGDVSPARLALIAHIDSIITARVAVARQAALEDATTIVEGRFTGMIAHDLRLVHIADAIRALAASQAAPAKAEGWISCTEKLPEDRQAVVFVVDCSSGIFDYLHGHVLGGRYIAGQGFGIPGLSIAASFWQPSPAAPSTPAKEPT